MKTITVHVQTPTLDGQTGSSFSGRERTAGMLLKSVCPYLSPPPPPPFTPPHHPPYPRLCQGTDTHRPLFPVSTADIESGQQLGRAEVLRGLRNFLIMDRPEHHSTDRLSSVSCQHSRHRIWSSAWQGRGAQRLEELSHHGQARASQH